MRDPAKTVWSIRAETLRGYGAALLSAGVAQLARMPLHPPTLMPFITYAPFILLAAALGGLGPGLLATVLCALESIWFAIEPIGSLRDADPQHWLGLGALACTGAVASLLFERLRQTRKEARTAFLELAAIQGHAPVLLLVVDDQLNVRSANALALQFSGRDVSELLDKRPGAFIGCLNHLASPGGCGRGPACSECAIRCTVFDSLRNGLPYQDVDAWIPVSIDGTEQIRCLRISTVPMQPDSASKTVLICAQDVTHSKRTDEELLKTHRRMSVILDSISDGLVVFDCEWCCTYANPSAGRMLHESPSEMLGQNLWELWPHARNSPSGGAYRRALEEKVPLQVETFYPEPLNTWFEVRCNPSPEGLSLFFTDITERKQAEERLRLSEARVRRKLESIVSPEGDIGDLELNDILDVGAIQSMMDDFYQLTGVPMSIIDLNGKILVGVGWQEVCTHYHRMHPEACLNCQESDTVLSAGVAEGEYRLYKCMNHMWDIVTPLMIGGKHAGNLFCGQFFFDDEAIDLELFRSQAARYGFPEQEYLAAIQAVPRLSRKTVETGVSYLMKLGQMLSQLSYSNIKLARSLAELNRLVTELKSKQQKLQDGEERWRLAIESTGLGTFDVDLRTEKIVWSALAKQQFGLSADVEVDYQTFAGALHPDDRAHVELALAEARRPRSGGRYADEYRAICGPSGEHHWFAVWGQVFFDDEQHPVRLLGVRRDITDRKHAEEALGASRAKLEAALASMTDAVFISDAEGHFINVNAACATFHRFRNKGECAKTFAAYPDILDVFLPDGTLAPLNMWAVPRALRGETATSVEYRLRRKDTGETWVGSYSFGPIRDKEGEIVGSVVVARDITEQSRAEAALQKTFGDLESALRAKTLLLKEVHHRVKNNLAVICSLLDMGVGGTVAPEAKVALEQSRQRVYSIALIHEMLYGTKDLARINFADYLKVLAGELSEAYGGEVRGIEVHVDIEPIEFDLDRAVPCALIMNELVTNAFKHAFPEQQRGAKISVSLREYEPRYLELRIDDNGVGCPPGRSYYNGKSVGWRIVNALTKQLGGSFHQGPPPGTRFTVRFPAGTSERTPDRSLAAAGTA